MIFAYFFLIIFNLFINIGNSENLTVFRSLPYESAYNRINYWYHKYQTLWCVSGNTKDAVVWNTNLEWITNQLAGTDKIGLEDSTLSNEFTDQDQKCRIDVDSSDCFAQWNQRYGDWNFTNSFDDPMGPVFDTRFEHFAEYELQPANPKSLSPFRQIHTRINGEDSTFKFNKNGALVVSIQAFRDAHFFVCEGTNYLKSFCYWLIIGGWENKITALRKCPKGVTLGYPAEGTPCKPIQAAVNHTAFTPNEWKTFIITWDEDNRELNLYDPNELLLSYSDKNYISDKKSNKTYYVFYRSPERIALFRFHEYNYTLTKQPGAILLSRTLIIGQSQELCIDMMIGLCKTCEMNVILHDGSGKQQKKSIFKRTDAYKFVKHSLPLWQHERFHLPNITGYPTPLSLEITAALSSESLDDEEYHWAITKFEQCLPEGTVKRVKMTASQDSTKDNYFWPTVKCQRLSYEYPYSEVVDARLAVHVPPRGLEYCPKYQIGPHCATNCAFFGVSDCKSIVMCQENRCFCPQGYYGSECTNTCIQGSYGYGCLKKCDNCNNEKCDFYDGYCSAGNCKQYQDTFYVPPYCNIAINTPSSPTFDQLNQTSLRAYLHYDDVEVKINSTLKFEITVLGSNDTSEQIASSAISRINNDNDEKVFFTIFSDLKPGFTYSIRMVIEVRSGNHMKTIFGKSANVTTLCNYYSRFEIIPDETSILINRISTEDSYTCPDKWYSLNLAILHGSTKNSASVNTDDIPMKFPMVISNLYSYHLYEVCIHGVSNLFNYCRNVSTLEGAPSKVVGLSVNSITESEAIISWDPPDEPNGVLRTYSLTIEVLYYIGCESRKMETPSKRLTSTTFDNIPADGSVSQKVLDLTPFVSYAAKVRAHTTKEGEESIITFDTKERHIPTSTYTNINYTKNKIAWSDPTECWTITGRIGGAKVFLFGLSKDVANFSDEDYTPWHTFEPGVSGKKTEIYGNELYRVQVHVIRHLNGPINESNFIDLTFLTDPKAPPKVKIFDIMEVDNEEKEMVLRWQALQSPTNGRLNYYTIDFVGRTRKSDVTIIYPNERCEMQYNYLCATLKQPDETFQYIEIRAYNEGVDQPSEPSRIECDLTEKAPSPPEIIKLEEFEKGIVYLQWQHPMTTGVRLKKFLIQPQIVTSDLVSIPKSNDMEILEYPVSRYQANYNMTLNLLPSTLYTILIEGSGRELRSIPSSSQIQTETSFAFAYDPQPEVDCESSLIKIVIPPVINDTRNSMLNILVKGPIKCSHAGTIPKNLAVDFGIEYYEEAWRVGTFRTSQMVNKSFTIGDEDIYNGITNCPLHIGSSYIIGIIVHEKKSNPFLDRVHKFTWKSEPIQIGPIPRKPHEAWAIPLLLIFVIIGAIFYYYYRMRKKNHLKKSQADEIIEPIPIHPVIPVNRVQEKDQIIRDEVINRHTTAVRETMLLTPANSQETLIEDNSYTEEMYENLKNTSTIKLNEFQDYVKQAVESGRLEQEYSLFPRKQMKPWEYGRIPQNKPKNRYGNLIAYDDTRVKLGKLPDDPYSDYINANYIKGYKKDKAYIATQGPKPNTLGDFWRMIWQERVQIICMLTNVTEGGKTKCEQYWPDIGKETKYGNVIVANVSHTVFADYTLRLFHVTCDQECRKIHQLHYTAWPDHGIPLYTHSVVSYLKKLLATPSGNGPIVVHCSAGVGRTGTIILCDICLRRAAAENVINVFEETEMMRTQRANMVDNKQQYLFAHLTLVECLLTLPTTIPCKDNLPKRIAEFKNQIPLQQQRLKESAWQDQALQSTSNSSVKLSEKNLAKNRYPNLIPTNSRLFIARYPTTDDESNYIAGVSVDSARRRDNYIASQLPLPNTVGDFWRMIAEFKVELIVLLQPIDDNDESYGKFIPVPGEEMEPVPFLILKGKSSDDTEIYIQQKVNLTDNSEKSATERLITILICKDWEPGRNKPPPKPVILVDLWQTAERISRSEVPTVVLCHDGVTGCGLYLALSFLLERMGLERECDVCLAIRAIRRSGTDFCNSIEQFEYLYDAALIYNDYFETYANFS